MLRSWFIAPVFVDDNGSSSPGQTQVDPGTGAETIIPMLWCDQMACHGYQEGTVLVGIYPLTDPGVGWVSSSDPVSEFVSRVVYEPVHGELD